MFGVEGLVWSVYLEARRKGEDESDDAIEKHGDQEGLVLSVWC